MHTFVEFVVYEFVIGVLLLCALVSLSCTFHQVSLVQLFTTRGVLSLYKNDPILSGTFRLLFGNLEL